MLVILTFLTRASLLVLVLLTARPIAGQELHDSGITLVGAAIAESGAAIQIYSSVQARERCDINEAVLAAEAERAFRRDGIDAQRVFLPDTAVVLNLVVLAIDSGAGFCAAALRVELLLISSAAAGLPPMLAAQGAHSHGLEPTGIRTRHPRKGRGIRVSDRQRGSPGAR